MTNEELIADKQALEEQLTELRTQRLELERQILLVKGALQYVNQNLEKGQ